MGGAVFSLNSDVTLINSTISRNGAIPGTGGTAAIGDGGALYVLTFGMNAAGTGAPSSSVVLKNTIFANIVGAGVSLVLDQRAGSLSIDASAPNFVATRRIAGTVTANFTGISTADPRGDLVTTDTGGPTKTLMLQATSPAIDTFDDSVCAAAPINGHDQRDSTRPVGSRCDVGAVEIGASFDKANGQSCTMHSECNSTFCTDGVCCATACAGGSSDCLSRR